MIFHIYPVMTRLKVMRVFNLMFLSELNKGLMMVTSIPLAVCHFRGRKTKEQKVTQIFHHQWRKLAVISSHQWSKRWCKILRNRHLHKHNRFRHNITLLNSFWSSLSVNDGFICHFTYSEAPLLLMCLSFKLADNITNTQQRDANVTILKYVRI